MFTHHPSSSRMSRSHVPCSPPEVQVADTRSSAPAISMVQLDGWKPNKIMGCWPSTGWSDFAGPPHSINGIVFIFSWCLSHHESSRFFSFHVHLCCMFIFQKITEFGPAAVLNRQLWQGRTWHSFQPVAPQKLQEFQCLAQDGAGWRDDGNKETKYMMKRMKNLDLVSKKTKYV